MTGDQTNCPLCPRRDDARRIYAHLMVDHRKSEISRALLESSGLETDSVDIQR